MSQQSRSAFITYVNANINTNNNQTITGANHNTALNNLEDSTVWYDERANYKFFHYYPMTKSSGFAGSEPSITGYAGERYIQLWNATPPSGGTVPVNAAYGDIVYYDGAAWVPDTDFTAGGGQNEDWIVYDIETGENFRFDKITKSWRNVGKGGAVISHNDTYGLQGGTTSEYFHLTAAELATVQASYNFKLAYLDIRVKEVVTSGFPASPIVDEWYIINEYPQKYIGGTPPLDYTAHPAWGVLIPPAVPQYNYITIEKDTNKIWYYDYKNKTWLFAGYNIHTDHNSNYGLQGGTTDEYYHLTADATPIAEKAKARVKHFSTYSVKSYVGIPANLPTSGLSDGDIYLDNEGAKQYVLSTTSWNLILDTTVNKEFYFIAEDDLSTYISNADNLGFHDANAGKILDHNSQYGLQGGSASERYHLTASQVSVIDAINTPVFSQTIYMNPASGNDSNNGSSLALAVKTEAGIVANMNCKVLTIIIPENQMGGSLGTDLLDALILKGVIKLTIQGGKTLQASAVSITQINNQLYEFDAAEVGTSYETDFGGGLLFIDNYQIKGVNTVLETTSSGFGTVLLPEDIGATYTGDIYELTTKIGITGSYEYFDIPIVFENIIVDMGGESYALGLNAEFNDCSIWSGNNFRTKAEFNSCAIRNKIINNSLIFHEECSFTDLVISSLATSVQSTSSVEFASRFIGNSLAIFGYETLIKSNQGSDLKVNEYLTLSGFTNVIDPTYGGSYDLNTPNTIIANTTTIGSFKVYLLNHSLSSFEYNNNLLINIMDYNLAGTVTFDFQDIVSINKEALYYGRDNDNFKILMSKLNNKYSLDVDEVTATTTHSMSIIETSITDNAKVDISISGDGNEYSASINISTNAPNIVILDGGADAGAGVFSGSIAYSSGGLDFAGLDNTKDYVIQVKTERFFS